MVGQEVVVRAWKEWGIQALVLLSLTLQITLLVLAEFRRRVRSGALMFCVWWAYLMADVTAIYVLGHMSVTSGRSSPLVAFWAPFLLLHLGGQDNITAYAIEDNQLWLRHLQALGVQVVAAGYVLYESSIISQPFLLRWATILMFLVGAIKYWERVEALRLASTSAAGKNYHALSTGVIDGRSGSLRFLDQLAEEILKHAKGAPDTDEARMVLAHRMLSLPKKLLKGSVHSGESYSNIPGGAAGLYKVVEMQMSLMHDTFYTKGELIHTTWYGGCIRVVSAVATGAAFVLFNLVVHHDDGLLQGYKHNRVDVAVTYVLFVGAVVLETLSLLRAAFSSWTYSEDKDWETNFLNRLRARTASFVRRLVRAAGWRGRGWSGSMGQLNLLQLSARSGASRGSKMARRMGLEDPWNTLAYSWSIPVSAFIEDKLVNYKQELDASEGGDPEASASAAAADDDPEAEPEVAAADPEAEEDTPEKRLRSAFNDMSLEERLLAFHIATNIYLTWWNQEGHGNDKHQQQQPNKSTNKAEAYKLEHSKQATAEAVEALSNYMVFLLAARPDMVSPTGSRDDYVELCYALSIIRRLEECGTAEELAVALRRRGDAMLGSTESERPLLVKTTADGVDVRRDHSGSDWFYLDDQGYERYAFPDTITTGCKVGAMLIRKHQVKTSLDNIAGGWVFSLYEAALGCSAYAHARQLSNGGELITVAALLAEYRQTGVYFEVN